MYNGVYLLELHKNNKVEYIRIPNKVTRYAKGSYNLSFNRIGVKYNNFFLSENTSRWWEKNYSDTYNISYKAFTTLTSNEIQSDGYYTLIRTSTAYTSIDVYGICLVYNTALVSFIDLPYKLELSDTDLLYVWYSIKMRW
jgi:hypothetical protein